VCVCVWGGGREGWVSETALQEHKKCRYFSFRKQSMVQYYTESRLKSATKLQTLLKKMTLNGPVTKCVFLIETYKFIYEKIY